MKINEDLKLTIYDIVHKGKEDGLTSDEITNYIVKAIEKESDEIDIDIHLTPNSRYYDKFIELLNKCKH